MEPGQWASDHSDALQDYFLKGMSYTEICREINARFRTSYSKNAIVGRAKRMGLVAPVQTPSPPLVPSSHPGPEPMRRIPGVCSPPPSALRPAEPLRLRCVGVRPRLISLLDLEPGDCRYPYGGDKEGEAISFCGHPRTKGSSYCAPHDRLTAGSGGSAARAAGAVVLRLVKAA